MEVIGPIADGLSHIAAIVSIETQHSILSFGCWLPLLSRLNEGWHFKSINWDGRQTSLNVAAPFLAEKKSIL